MPASSITPISGAVDAHVVADGVQSVTPLRTSARIRFSGNPAQAEAPQHDFVARANIGHGLIGVLEYFVNSPLLPYSRIAYHNNEWPPPAHPH